MTQEPRKQRICLVTPAHLSTNPRLIKEADALASAGYNVSVISARFMSWPDFADQQYLNRPWAVQKIEYGPLAKPSARAFYGLRRRLCRAIVQQIGPLRGVAERACHWVVPELANTACATPADLYIAHNLAALPAAYRAARKHRALLGFDAEDFHSGELPVTPTNALSITLSREIERRYLQHCDYITAASPGIARAYAETFRLQLPVVTLNVFPKTDAPSHVTDKGAATPSPSLYWFSQTIGPDRGLETVVKAIAVSRSRPTLFMRGNPISGYVESLNALAERHGIADLLKYLPTASPGEMVRLAGDFDVGIASEPGYSENNELALSNKLFTYLLAGVPVLASATAAQAAIAPQMPGAVFTYSQNAVVQLAAEMDKLLLSPGALAAARHAAWSLAQERYNWDVEQASFLRVVSTVLNRPQEGFVPIQAG